MASELTIIISRLPHHIVLHRIKGEWQLETWNQDFSSEKTATFSIAVVNGGLRFQTISETSLADLIGLRMIDEYQDSIIEAIASAAPYEPANPSLADVVLSVLGKSPDGLKLVDVVIGVEQSGHFGTDLPADFASVVFQILKTLRGQNQVERNDVTKIYRLKTKG